MSQPQQLLKLYNQFCKTWRFREGYAREHANKCVGKLVDELNGNLFLSICSWKNVLKEGKLW